MSSQLLTNVLIGIAVLGLVLYRQLRVRRLDADRSNRVLLILAVVGVVELVDYGRSQPIAGYGVTALLLSLGSAAALGYARAYTVRIWFDARGWWRRGTPLTAALWLISVGVHFGIDAVMEHLASGHGSSISGLASASMVLYLAASLGLQGVVLGARVRRLADDEHRPAPVAGYVG